MKPIKMFAEKWPVKKWLWMAGVATVLGLVCTIITWPGIFYTDSYGRWQMAVDLTRLNFATQDDWLSAPPQLFMAVAYLLSGGRYGGYTFIQAVVFFFTAFFAIDAFVPKGRWVAWILFALCPVFYGFSVYLEMSVGCVTALLWLLWLLLCFDHNSITRWSPRQMALYAIAALLLYFVMLGYRQNAFTVLPVLFFAAGLLAKRLKTWRPLVLHIVSAAMALLVIGALPKVLHFGYQRNGASGSVGFLWETVCMLGELQDKPEYHDYLDFLGEEGTTQSAVEANNYHSIYGYHEYITNSAVAAGDHAAQIRAKYIHLILREPVAFVTVKTRFWGYAMGVVAPLSDNEYDYNRLDRMAEFGLRDTQARRVFWNSYHLFLEDFSFVRRPWLVYSATLGLLVVAGGKMKKTQRYRLWILYAAAVFYYGSFLVTTQSQEFRYFFVPLVLLYIVGAASLGELCSGLWARLTRRRQTERLPLEGSH